MRYRTSTRTPGRNSEMLSVHQSGLGTFAVPGIENRGSGCPVYTVPREDSDEKEEKKNQQEESESSVSEDWICGVRILGFNSFFTLTQVDSWALGG